MTSGALLLEPAGGLHDRLAGRLDLGGAHGGEQVDLLEQTLAGPLGEVAEDLRQHLLVGVLQGDGEFPRLDALEQRLQRAGLERGDVLEGEQRGTDLVGQVGGGLGQRRHHRLLGVAAGEGEDLGEHAGAGDRHDLGGEHAADPGAQRRVDLEHRLRVHGREVGDAGRDVGAQLLGEPGQDAGRDRAPAGGPAPARRRPEARRRAPAVPVRGRRR